MKLCTVLGLFFFLFGGWGILYCSANVCLLLLGSSFMALCVCALCLITSKMLNGYFIV